MTDLGRKPSIGYGRIEPQKRTFNSKVSANAFAASMSWDRLREFD